MIFKIDSTIWFANENFDEKQNFNCVFIRALQSTATEVVNKIVKDKFISNFYFTITNYVKYDMQ